MFGSDGFFGSKKTNTSVDTPDNVFEPVNTSPDKEKKTNIKSIAGVAIALLVVLALLGLNSAVSDSIRKKKSKKRNVTSNDFVIDDYDIPADLTSFKKDADAYKGKQGFFSSIFCSGYQKSAFCK